MVTRMWLRSILYTIGADPARGCAQGPFGVTDRQSHPRRGGLILYRTVIKGSELQGTAVLDIGEPVRDYARVSLFSFSTQASTCRTPLIFIRSGRVGPGWAGLYRVYTCINRRLDDVSRSIQLYRPECSLVAAGEGQGERHPISCEGPRGACASRPPESCTSPLVQASGHHSF